MVKATEVAKDFARGEALVKLGVAGKETDALLGGESAGLHPKAGNPDLALGW